MKILSAENTRKADAYTIKHEPVQSIDLMERASLAFVSIFTRYFNSSIPVIIFCGTGNNGGDGLAVARLLHQQGYHVNIFVINYENGKGSEDFKTNLNRLKEILTPQLINHSADIPDIPEGKVIIDAIFGSGLTRPVTELYAEVIASINNSPSKKVSIDIASGLFADKAVIDGAIIKPDITISFQMPKLAFMIPENEMYVGSFKIADIGLDKNFIENSEGDNHYVIRSDIQKKLKNRKKFAHKGNFGRALIISGSLGKMGAAVLCARSCLRSGVGLLTMHVPLCGYEILQASVPEAMTTVDKNKDIITEIPDITNYDVIGIGPGIGINDPTRKMLENLLEFNKNPMVFDADAINLLGLHKYLLKKIPANSILTPHIVEFERIAGKSKNHFDRILLQKEFSEKYSVIVILKGAYSAISLPNGNTYFNSTGNPGMATGGSGDVLTGMVTGFLAQAYNPADSAILATYLHGLSGDIASKKLGENGMIAGDIIQYLPKAVKKFDKKNRYD